MLRGNLDKVILASIIGAAFFYLIIPLDFAVKESPRSLAFIPHEDPGETEPVFSGTPFLMFNSDYLDYVLQMNPDEVEAILNKQPLLNILPDLKEATGNFFASGRTLSHLMEDIDEDLTNLRALREQMRLDEANEQAEQTSAKLYEANSELQRIERVTASIGEKLGVLAAPEGSDLRQSYDEMLERIDKIDESLALYSDQLEDLLKSTDIMTEELLEPMDISLEVQPLIALVGDNIHFEGILTSENEPLAGREVDILLNDSRYITVKTDTYGYYQGILPVPYWYLPELELQALYSPQNEDTGLYPASLSPVIQVKVLFFKAGLDVTVDDKAFPGREITVAGRFDYGHFPPLTERKAEIYFDDILITEFITQESFAQKIKISPEADMGKHTITVSATGTAEYSPVVTSTILNVTKATTVLDLNIPRVAVIPGGVGLEGNLFSEVGPLNGASINIALDKSQVELASSEDGAFDTEIEVGMGFSMIGSQDLEINIVPREPWHAPLITSGSILMVNVINCGGVFAVLVILSIYLPGRLRRRPGVYARRRLRPAVVIAPPEPAPAYIERVTVLTSTEESAEASGEPRSSIFYWYRWCVRLIGRITELLLKSQQTLREFAKESSRVLGPATKYFTELTEIVERLLYSQYRPTEVDAIKGEQLSRAIEEGARPEVITPPLLDWQLGGDGRAFVIGSWRNSTTWLWILLIAAVTCYACLLLFGVPLLLISLGCCLPLVIADDLTPMATKGGTKG